MAKIDPPKPPAIQEMEDAEMAAFEKALVGVPVRIEIALDSVMAVRDRVRALRDACDRADMILTDHVQNPKPIHGRERVMDWMVLSQVKSLFASVRRLTSHRLGTPKSRREKSK